MKKMKKRIMILMIIVMKIKKNKKIKKWRMVVVRIKNEIIQYLTFLFDLID